MEYHWSMEDIINDSEEIRKQINNETDFNKTLFLRKMYDTISYFIYSNYSSPEINISRKDYYQQLLHGLCADVCAYGRYYSLIERFYNSLLFLEYEKDKIKKNLKKCTSAHFSNEETMSLVNEFFMSIPDDEIRKVFKQIYDQRYGIYRFDSEEEYESNAYDDAYNIFVGGLNKNYINVCDVNGGSKVINTVHETGHAITNLMNPLLSLRSDNDFFDEVQSLFFEILALKILQNEKIDSREFPILLFADLKSYFDLSNELIIQQCIAKVASDNGYKFNNKLLHKLQDNYDISKDLTIKLLGIKFENEAQYPLSFAVALKIVNIYLDNPKEGIALLKRTIMNPLHQDDLEFIFGIMNPYEGLKEAGEEITLKYKNVITK